MNKQQLAAKIWESANQMRSKIEANEYKDYILGFIFYKYLSDKELQFAKKEDFSADEIKALSEDDAETTEYIKSNVGYFIAYEHLFSTWIAMGKDFDVSNVRDALSAFSRLIHPVHKKLFDGVFETLQTGLSKLGESAAAQTKAISQLIHLIKDIPMDGRQDYDVLGFIYEYLISMFAANAGKKAGEFYTPHEVSLLMSEIIAHHVKDKKEIQIYDPTSGSGSLLINIGQSVAKHMDNQNNIKYYAQELKQNTYNLTRMNLVMRGILPSNIITRNGDTLEDDWPFFDESDPTNSYNPLYLDAVVSNPPYSQKWESEHKETDPRYARFGLAPKTKADYAFLLHDLYHLKPDGIMTIVLPHGVLFRGGEEGIIRKKLIEANHIDAIIGLPANIFFGTGIPTIIMVLKQKRSNTDVLIVDASKGFIKVGKNNKLKASDIKRIADTVVARQTTPKFSKLVSRDQIRENEYNLNIPRYVDSSEPAESWDIYATMFGGIPEKEINALDAFWQAFPALRAALFSATSSDYSALNVEDIKTAITQHADVKAFATRFTSAFADFDAFLKQALLTNMQTVNIQKEITVISDDIFSRLNPIALIDRYEAYQLLDDHWTAIAIDLEIIQTEGFAATKQVDPNIVTKKKDGKEQEVQEGWLGHILPFEMVQQTYLNQELQQLQHKENRLAEISAEIEEILDSLSEEV
jgi:type I restriction enzyme M protein